MPTNIGYTDYPITLFGDELGKKAPLRRVFVLMYDKDKYVKVFVQKEENVPEGIVFEMKRGYVFATSHRLGEGPLLPVESFGVDMETWLSLKAIEG